MPRLADLKTKIFLDSGDPNETREAIRLLGFLDGQTTNPSLIAKNTETAGRKFSPEEFLDFYKKIVQEIAGLIPNGSVSVEVYADANTKAEEMLGQAREFNTWIPNAHIKLPIIYEGLKVAEQSVKEGVRVNMTLCFSQEQAAAVYAATQGAKKGQVYISPFVGRLDDIGENGMDLVANIIKMYREAKSHVEVLTASVRNSDHLLYAIKLGSDIITAPFKVLQEWASSNFPPQAWGGLPADLSAKAQARVEARAKAGIQGEVEPLQDWQPISKGLRSILYKELDLNKTWQELYKEHELTVKGIEKFAEDWKKLIQ